MCNNDVEMLSSARPEYDFKQGNQKTTHAQAQFKGPKQPPLHWSRRRCIGAQPQGNEGHLARRNWDGSILFRFVDGSMWSPNGWFKMVTVNQLNLAQRMKKNNKLAGQLRIKFRSCQTWIDIYIYNTQDLSQILAKICKQEDLKLKSGHPKDIASCS